MSEINVNQLEDPVIIIEEKGDLDHAIRCTEQAEKRAESPWLKRACAFRLKMLQIQKDRKNRYN